MRAPSARVGRNRRRAFLYAPLFILGAVLMAAAFPTLNAGYLAGLLIMLTGAAGFIIETGHRS